MNDENKEKTVFLSDSLLGEEISVLLIRILRENVLLPELWSQEGIGVTKGKVQGLDEVTSGTGVTSGGGVAIIDTSHMQEFLSNWGRDKSGTTRGRNETNRDGSALSCDLAGDSVRKARRTSPVSTTNGGDGELGCSDSPTNSSRNFSGALNSKTNVPGTVTESDESLEAGSLTGRGLLLNRHDLHDLIF
jgi:hypothetical protein